MMHWGIVLISIIGTDPILNTVSTYLMRHWRIALISFVGTDLYKLQQIPYEALDACINNFFL